MLFFTSCKSPTRKEVNAKIWLNNSGGPAYAKLCLDKPELKDHGFYRKLNNGKLEFVSFCSPTAAKFLAVTEKDFNEMMDKYIPEPNQTQINEQISQ